MNKNEIKFYKEFVQQDIDFYLKECAFNDRERTLFEMRLKEFTLEEISEKMNVSKSTVDRINKTMKQKISKVKTLYSK